MKIGSLTTARSTLLGRALVDHPLRVMPPHTDVREHGPMAVAHARPEGTRPVARPQHPVLFINPRSGGGRAVRVELGEQARALGIDCVVLEPGGDLAALVRTAIAGGADTLGMAGGDGSMAIVAGAASAHDLPFVCVPAGTRNHFARDLGVARHGPITALAAFTTAAERRVDLAEVNGQVFVNNLSIGIYGDAVQRPGYRSGKLRTLMETAREVVGPSAAAPRLSIRDDRGHAHTHPAVILVSNNPYAFEPPAVPGTRARLDSGRLGVLVLDGPGGPPHRSARAWTVPSLDLDAGEAVHAGRDGEAVTLASPLHFVSRPAALRVRIPSTSRRRRPVHPD
jgi:diacylglycerol kinase family enzyme